MESSPLNHIRPEARQSAQWIKKADQNGDAYDRAQTDTSIKHPTFRASAEVGLVPAGVRDVMACDTGRWSVTGDATTAFDSLPLLPSDTIIA